MKFSINLNPNHGIKTDARALPQRNDNGYGGFGYGGDHLYLAWNEDSFQPAVYAIRADSLDVAYEVAEASLAPVLDSKDIADVPEKEIGTHSYCCFAADGTIVNTESLRMVNVR